MSNLKDQLIRLGSTHPTLRDNLRPVLEFLDRTSSEYSMGGGRAPAKYKGYADQIEKALKKVGLWRMLDWEFSLHSGSRDTRIGYSVGPFGNLPNGEVGDLSIHFSLDDREWDASFKNEDSGDFWYQEYARDLDTLVRNLKKAFDASMRNAMRQASLERLSGLKTSRTSFKDWPKNANLRAQAVFYLKVLEDLRDVIDDAYSSLPRSTKDLGPDTEPYDLEDVMWQMPFRSRKSLGKFYDELEKDISYLKQNLR